MHRDSSAYQRWIEAHANATDIGQGKHNEAPPVKATKRVRASQVALCSGLCRLLFAHTVTSPAAFPAGRELAKATYRDLVILGAARLWHI